MKELSECERLAVQTALSFLVSTLTPCELTKMYFQPHRSTFVCTPELMKDLRSALSKLEPWRRP